MLDQSSTSLDTITLVTHPGGENHELTSNRTNHELPISYLWFWPTALERWLRVKNTRRVLRPLYHQHCCRGRGTSTFFHGHVLCLSPACSALITQPYCSISVSWTFVFSSLLSGRMWTLSLVCFCASTSRMLGTPFFVSTLSISTQHRLSLLTSPWPWLSSHLCLSLLSAVRPSLLFLRPSISPSCLLSKITLHFRIYLSNLVLPICPSDGGYGCPTHHRRLVRSYPYQNIEGRGPLSHFFSLCLVRYVEQHISVHSIDASARLLVEDPRLHDPHQDTAYCSCQLSRVRPEKFRGFQWPCQSPPPHVK